MSKLENFKRTPPSLYGQDIEAKRAEVLAYFLETFELFERLFKPLKNEKVFYSRQLEDEQGQR